ncbi:5-hydroxytryptamine receptor 3A-like [Erpetoichthys calabaricus]|uniref:5-hydroxytryptamine receptor 3A-like n=1 Tax=Erpetoichthys calabaricus TaxID=27687 RepID=UPI0022340350|nr:5-hydroxytryptamine receptor 3A-like [Erpetoichthys calabaricus]
MSNTLLLLLLPFLLSVNGCSTTPHHTGWSAFGLVGSSFNFHAQAGPPSLQQQLRSILKGYAKGVRPVRNWRQASVVTLDFTVQAVLDVVEKQEKVVLFIEVRQRWRDEYLHWHPAQFHGVHSFSVPVESIWVPDITIFEK